MSDKYCLQTFPSHHLLSGLPLIAITIFLQSAFCSMCYVLFQPVLPVSFYSFIIFMKYLILLRFFYPQWLFPIFLRNYKHWHLYYSLCTPWIIMNWVSYFLCFTSISHNCGIALLIGLVLQTCWMGTFQDMFSILHWYVVFVRFDDLYKVFSSWTQVTSLTVKGKF